MKAYVSIHFYDYILRRLSQKFNITLWTDLYPVIVYKDVNDAFNNTPSVDGVIVQLSPKIENWLKCKH